MWARSEKVKQIVRLTLFLLAAVSVAGCRTAPIADPIMAPLTSPPGASLADIDEAVWRAGRKLGWEIQQIQPGSLRGRLSVRRHTAVVSIRQDGKTVRVAYEDSTNLLYAEGAIHESYNRWVERLVVKIQEEPVWPAHDLAP